MNLTVTARIVGGSGLVILLLIALSFTGLSGVATIESGLNSVTDRSTPMLIAGSEKVSSLLKASMSVNRFHQSKQLTQLDSFATAYENHMLANKRSSEALKNAAQEYRLLRSLRYPSGANISA